MKQTTRRLDIEKLEDQQSSDPFLHNAFTSFNDSAYEIVEQPYDYRPFEELEKAIESKEKAYQRLHDAEEFYEMMSMEENRYS